MIEVCFPPHTQEREEGAALKESSGGFWKSSGRERKRRRTMVVGILQPQSSTHCCTHMASDTH